MSSNRIQIVKEGSLYEDEMQFYHAIYDYWSEKASFDQTKFAFDYYRESYFLTLSKKQADELMSHGYQLEYTIMSVMLLDYRSYIYWRSK